MKKQLVMFVASALTLAACNNDALVDMGKDSAEAGSVTFVLEPETGISTRSGRDLYSSEALQEVENMTVYAFKQNGSDFVYETVTIGETAGQAGFSISWAKGTKSKSYTVKPKMTGTYKFLAVGLDAGKDNFKALELTGKKLEEVLIALNDNATNREAFAGVSGEMTLSADAGTKIAITLNRVVAGVLGYFTNIPAKVNDTDVKSVKVKLYGNQNTAVTLGAADNAQTGSIPRTDSETLLTLNIPENATTNTNGQYEFTPTPISGVGIKANSLLGALYVMPIIAPSTASVATLTVELCDNNGAALKTWKVKDNNNTLQYALASNHFYSIGIKGKNQDPNNPGNPDDTDTPIDLSKDQDIVITVDANWNTVHNMELE